MDLLKDQLRFHFKLIEAFHNVSYLCAGLLIQDDGNGGEDGDGDGRYHPPDQPGGEESRIRIEQA